jgi:hypothetical protein
METGKIGSIIMAILLAAGIVIAMFSLFSFAAAAAPYSAE